MARPVAFWDSELFPLPHDYQELTDDGKRLSRVNACSLRGTPELEVASWQFFRENYLLPCNYWYNMASYVESPPAHATWIRDWNTHTMLVHLAPRGGCKSTVNMEDILKKIITRPHWECALFLSTHKFVGKRLGAMMAQIEGNQYIIDDFGKLKCPKGSGLWNRGSAMELTNGSKVDGFPLKGAALGIRPSGLIVLDDVEKSDDLVLTPSDLRAGMEDLFFNALYPMSRSPGGRIPVRIIGTIYSRKMFIYWLWAEKQDPRVVKYFKRVLMTVHDMSTKDFMNSTWIAEEKERLGAAAFSAQCLNVPTTSEDRILDIHPELCTYSLEDVDQATYNDPLNTQAVVVTHTLKGMRASETKENLPVPKIQHRPWSEVLSGMRRFITIDTARTTTPTSDFSVVHVMGFENSHKHRDTLYSLDMYIGRVRPEELIREVYRLAVKWDVWLIGVEAYEFIAEFYERCRDNLPAMYGSNKSVPRIVALKPPTKMDKAHKIMRTEWRFRHYRIKLPMERREEPAYKRLFYEIENFTEDMALLEHDDAIDTLAMHTFIGKQHQSAAPDIDKSFDPIAEMLEGHSVDECGIPLMSGINASDLTNEQIRGLIHLKYDEAEEEFGPIEDWQNRYLPPLEHDLGRIL